MSLSFLTGYVLGRQDAAAGAMRAAAIPVTGSTGAEDLIDLHERIDRLLLVVSAMASLLEEHGAIGEAELANRVRELDESDGVIDGKRTLRPQPCSQCDARIAPGLEACQFCGTPVAATSAPGPLDQV